jgi:hypothetical protein
MQSSNPADDHPSPALHTFRWCWRIMQRAGTSTHGRGAGHVDNRYKLAWPACCPDAVTW